MQLRWSHCVLYVRDLPGMLDFYQQVLGFEVTDEGPIVPKEGAPRLVFMSQHGDEHHQLALLGIRQDEGRPNSVDHNAFRVDSLADVREMLERVTKDGRASEINPISHGNTWSVYFRDPEQNGIEVFCDTPFHVAQPQGKPWDPSLSDEALLAWTRESFGHEPTFEPLEDFVATNRKRFADR